MFFLSFIYFSINVFWLTIITLFQCLFLHFVLNWLHTLNRMHHSHSSLVIVLYDKDIGTNHFLFDILFLSAVYYTSNEHL